MPIDDRLPGAPEWRHPRAARQRSRRVRQSVSRPRGHLRKLRPVHRRPDAEAVQAQAMALLQELAGHPHLRRLSMVRHHHRFQRPALFQLVLDRTRDLAPAEPNESLDYAELAVSLATVLDGPPDLHARRLAAALGVLAGGHRLLGEFESARRELDRAFLALAKAGGPPAESAGLLLQRAGLLRDLGRFEEAALGFEAARALYRRLGERHLEGRTLLAQAEVEGHLDPHRGIALIEAARPLLDFESEPRLELVVAHDLAWFTADAGQETEAAGLLERARPVYDRFPDSTTRLHRLWLEGRILRGCGQIEEAIASLLRVWYAFAELALLHELALCGLDLLEVYLLGGKTREADRLAGDFAVDLQQEKLDPDGVAAWISARHLTTRDDFTRRALYFRRNWRLLACAPPEMP